MNRFWGGLLLLLSFGVHAQSEITISGDALVSGTADAQIRTFVRNAAQLGQTISVSAPGYWHDQVREQIDAAAPAATVRYTDVVNELVILRAEDKVAPVAAAPEPPPEPPKPVAPTPPPMQAPAVNIDKPPVAASVSVPVPPIAPVVTEPPPPRVTDPAIAAREAAIKRLADGLNNGEPITATLTLAELNVADRLVVADTAVAVVRSQRVRQELYLLSEPLGDTERSELKKLTDTTFEVLRTFTTAQIAPSVDAEAPAEALTAEQELLNFQQRLNGGKAFEQKLTMEGLLEGDVLYVGQFHSIVLRADRIRLERFIVDGKIDLEKLSVQRQATNRYKLLSTPR